jgi:hypothetical protein
LEVEMGRIIKEIEVEGRALNALFDTGATNTYITREFAPPVVVPLRQPFRVGLGGEPRELRETCILQGKIEGLDFATDGYIVDGLGVADGKRLDMIIGVTTMEKWDIRLHPKTGELDLEGLRRREFTEY